MDVITLIYFSVYDDSMQMKVVAGATVAIVILLVIGKF